MGLFATWAELQQQQFFLAGFELIENGQREKETNKALTPLRQRYIFHLFRKEARQSGFSVCSTSDASLDVAVYYLYFFLIDK